MLSIGRLGTTGGAEFSLDKVANNVDDYYLGAVKRPASGSVRHRNGSGSWARSKLTPSGTCWPADPPSER